MEVDIFSGVATVVLVVVGFFAVGAMLFAIFRLIERRRRLRNTRMSDTLASAETSGSYGSEDCYRDCTRTDFPFSERQYPSCAEACGFSK